MKKLSSLLNPLLLLQVPERAYDQFAVKSLPSNQSQAEIRALNLLDRVSKIYLSLIQIGNEVRRVANDPSKNS